MREYVSPHSALLKKGTYKKDLVNQNIKSGYSRTSGTRRQKSPPDIILGFCPKNCLSHMLHCLKFYHWEALKFLPLYFSTMIF